jgi:flagellar basal-body rod modification protein FlgD
MTGANPIVSTPPPASSGTSSTSSSAQTQALNELGPNAFITLLTAQLQAQDPLDPLDPNQMVDELTSMNTLQETIQMREDLDTLVSETQGGTGSSGSGSGAASPNGTQTTAGTAGAGSVVAASALKSGLAALTHALAPSSTSSVNAQTNSKTQSF